MSNRCRYLVAHSLLAQQEVNLPFSWNRFSSFWGTIFLASRAPSATADSRQFFTCLFPSRHCNCASKVRCELSRQSVTFLILGTLFIGSSTLFLFTPCALQRKFLILLACSLPITRTGFVPTRIFKIPGICAYKSNNIPFQWDQTRVKMQLECL